MAPRKTKTVEASPTPNAETVAALAEVEQGSLQVFDKVEDLMNELNADAAVRFQVALAVWPKIVTELEVTKLDDENEAGACARIAFEYADAFIAQSKKRDYDAG